MAVLSILAPVEANVEERTLLISIASNANLPFAIWCLTPFLKKEE